MPVPALWMGSGEAASCTTSPVRGLSATSWPGRERARSQAHRVRGGPKRSSVAATECWQNGMQRLVEGKKPGSNLLREMAELGAFRRRSASPRFRSSVLKKCQRFGGETLRELTRCRFAAERCRLTRPKGHEVSGPRAFCRGAKRSQRTASEGKGGGQVGYRSDFAHHPVDDSAGRSPSE